MRLSVTLDEYSQLEVKPAALLEEYLRLLESDVRTQLVTGRTLLSVPCTACNSASATPRFWKCGLQYMECQKCGSLYISPRPDEESIRAFYRHSATGIFWRNEFAVKTSPRRSARIIKPRFRWIADTVAEYLPCAERFGDVNTNQPTYLQEIEEATFCRHKVLIDPFLDVTLSRPGRLEVLTRPIEALEEAESFSVITLFEVADRTSNVERLLGAVGHLLRPGGLCFITATLSTGFDIQILGERAVNLCPPDRLNVFSKEGLEHIVERLGFECLEFSTPGIFDCANVEAALARDPQTPIPEFVRYLLEQRDERVKHAFQQFLQASLLSSHGRMVFRKRASRAPAEIH